MLLFLLWMMITVLLMLIMMMTMIITIIIIMVIMLIQQHYYLSHIFVNYLYSYPCQNGKKRAYLQTPGISWKEGLKGLFRGFQGLYLIIPFPFWCWYINICPQNLFARPDSQGILRHLFDPSSTYRDAMFVDHSNMLFHRLDTQHCAAQIFTTIIKSVCHLFWWEGDNVDSWLLPILQCEKNFAICVWSFHRVWMLGLYWWKSTSSWKW